MAEKSPAEQTLDAHLDRMRFQAGVEKGRWRVLKYAFPHLYVNVAGIDPETGRSVNQDFHAECSNYPAAELFVERWQFNDDDSNGCLPPAPKEGSPGYIDALKEWGPGGGIYRAWQRHAAVHNEWKTKRPDEAWNKDRDITFVMEKLYELVSEQAVWLASRT